MSTIAFDGGTVEILEGDSIVGPTSGQTATVKKITIITGAYSTGDAAGFLSVISNSGTWTNNEEIQVSGVNCSSCFAKGFDQTHAYPCSCASN